ncbi:hypothetical protein N0V82_010279 [Gnomoniopsis sp. IMI 355080]|nr:hypothetical protein N0V82_010279 [Gnomoniopsis sp. IMI 355080]
MSLTTQLRAQLQCHALPPSSETWLQTLISSRNPPPPLPSLVMTAKTRLLASDLTTSGLLDSTRISMLCFPSAITTPTVKETHLASDVYAQVVDIENLSRSRSEEIAELEAIERGEQTRGREVIRLPVNNEGGEELAGTRPPEATARPQAEPAPSTKNATHRLVLQDSKGQKVYGLELVRIPEIVIGTLSIGAKILLKKGTVVARGTILLDPKKVQVLGGKIEAWHKAWLDGRLVRLKEVIAARNQE